MKRRTLLVAIACLCISTALQGQYGGRHGGSNSSSKQGTSATPADNPDLADFKRAVAVEATDAQTTEIQNLAKCTEVARQKAQALRQSVPQDIVSHATAAQDAIDEVQRQQRDFLRTFSDAQASGLKKQTKKLNQSNTIVMKEAKKLSVQLDKIPPDAQRLEGTAANLEQALATLQSDQNALGKEMGVETH